MIKHYLGNSIYLIYRFSNAPSNISSDTLVEECKTVSIEFFQEYQQMMRSIVFPLCHIVVDDSVVVSEVSMPVPSI